MSREKNRSAKTAMCYACDECGGTDITFSANASFDVESQDFVMGDFHDDDPWCADCQSECRALWLTVEDAQSLRNLKQLEKV